MIAKFKFPGKNLLFALFTITLLVPGQSKAQPLFSLVMKLNLYDNIWGVAAGLPSFGLAMSMFILKSTFMSIPKSLDEAASLEGANFFDIFWRINLPLAKSGLATAGILMFLNNWKNYFYASLLTSSDANGHSPWLYSSLQKLFLTITQSCLQPLQWWFFLVLSCMHVHRNRYRHQLQLPA